MANDAAKVSARATLNELAAMLETGDISPELHKKKVDEIEKSGVLTRSEIQETLKGFQSLEDVPEKATKRSRKGRKDKQPLKKPSFMKGGSYKGKSHMYAAGGMVKELKI
jgi:hypothetical protein